MTSGGKFVTDILAEVLARDIGLVPARPRHAALSGREMEVLRLIGSGLAVSKIAHRVALSVKTVSTYRQRVLDKLGLRDNAVLMHYVLHNGLIDWVGRTADVLGQLHQRLNGHAARPVDEDMPLEGARRKCRVFNTHQLLGAAAARSWQRLVSGPRWAARVTATTACWPRRSTGRTRQS